MQSCKEPQCNNTGTGSEHSPEKPCRTLQKEEDSDDNQISRQSADLIDGVLQAQSFTAPAFFRILERKCIPHAKLNMVTKRIHKNADNHQHPVCRNKCLCSHAHHHDYSADSIYFFCRKSVQRGKDKHQGKAWQFPEKLRNPFVKA